MFPAIVAAVLCLEGGEVPQKCNGAIVKAPQKKKNQTECGKLQGNFPGGTRWKGFSADYLPPPERLLVLQVGGNTARVEDRLFTRARDH